MSRNTKVLALAIWVSLALLTGCQSGSQTATEEQPAATAAGRASRPGLNRRTSAPAEPRTVTVTVPAGTELPIRLSTGISSGTAQVGSTFEGTLATALVVNGIEVAPVGSKVTGTVTNAVSSGRLSHPAELALTLASLTPEGGQESSISTSTWSMKEKSHKKRDIEMIGGGAGVGALIGAIAGKGKGAAIGGAVGAAGGTAAAAATGKKEIELAPETRLNFKLTGPVTLTVRKKA